MYCTSITISFISLLILILNLLHDTETSANTLSFALVLIALHPEVQQKIYDESMRVWPDGSYPTSKTFTSVCYHFFTPYMAHDLHRFHSQTFKDDFPKFVRLCLKKIMTLCSSS